MMTSSREKEGVAGRLCAPPPSLPPRPATQLNGGGGPLTSPLPPNFPSNASSFGADSASDSDKSLKMKIKRTKSGRQEIVKAGEGGMLEGEVAGAGAVSPGRGGAGVPLPPTPPHHSHPELNGGTKTPSKATNFSNNLSNSSLQQLTTKRLKVSVN